MHPKRRAIPDRPFKASESYQSEDRHLFFGREQEASQLRSLILAAPMSLLHAPSGAGKTSLLNAHVIPGIESRGWFVARMTPGANPLRSLRASVLLSVIPIPEFEADSVRAARDFCHRLGGTNPTIGQARTAWESLEPRDVRRRQLVSPYEATLETSGMPRDAGWYTPGFCRVLQGIIDTTTWAERLSMLVAGIANRPSTPRPRVVAANDIDDDTTLDDLQKWLADRDREFAYRDLLKASNTFAPGLVDFFVQIENRLGPWLADTGLVVILDQFEEIFTLLSDPGTAAVRGVRPSYDEKNDFSKYPNRRAFLSEFERLFRASQGAPLPDDHSVRIPLSFVISMRDDYIAQLDDIRQFAGDIDRSTFHLTFLSSQHAETVIREPAALFGATFTDDCFEQIHKPLLREERFLIPSEVQIVCDKFWRERGSAGTRPVATGKDTQECEIVFDAGFLNDHLGGVGVILQGFFLEFLDQFGDKAHKYECLELFEPLITIDGTRNIVDEKLLLDAPFVDRELRQTILNRATAARILRIEKRLEQRFVEITHEFIIPPLKEALRDAFIDDYGYNRFREARRELVRFHRDGWLVGAYLTLTAAQFEALLDNHSRIRWPWWAAQMMVRNAIRLDRPASDFVSATRLFEQAPPMTAQATSDSLVGRNLTAGSIGMDGLRALARNLTANDIRLDPDQLEFARRSVLESAAEGDYDEIRYWFAD